MKIMDLGLYHQIYFNFLLDPEALRSSMPRSVDLDLFEGKAVVTVAALTFSQARLFGVSLLKAPAFGLEIRTYVKEPARTEKQNELKTGTLTLAWHLSNSRLQALFRWRLGIRSSLQPITREIYFEPYEKSSRGNFYYRTHLGKQEGVFYLRSTSSPQPAMAGYIEHFVAERKHWFIRHGEKLRVIELKHEPWYLWETDGVRCDLDWSQTSFAFLHGKEIHSSFVVKGSKSSLYPSL